MTAAFCSLFLAMPRAHRPFAAPVIQTLRQTAFLFLEDGAPPPEVPPWAIRLVVPTPALEQAAREAAEEAKAAGLDLIDLDELPQL